jgi:hypothetical protein
MGEKSGKVSSLLEKAEDYSKTSFELLKLKAVDLLSSIISSMLPKVAAILILFFSFVLGSIGIALWLGEILGKIWYGFFAVAGFYLIIGLVLLFVLNKWLKKLIGDFIVKQIFK